MFQGLNGEFYSVGKVHMEFDLLAEDVKGRAGDILEYDVPQIENWILFEPYYYSYTQIPGRNILYQYPQAPICSSTECIFLLKMSSFLFRHKVMVTPTPRYVSSRTT